MATRDYVLQRCVRRTRKTSTWQTVCLPVTYREGLAQPEAARLGFTVKEAAPWQG